jgi:hypothetical protein
MTFNDYIERVAIDQGSLVSLVPNQAKPSIYYYEVNNEYYLSKIYEGEVASDPEEINIIDFLDIWTSELVNNNNHKCTLHTGLFRKSWRV